MVIIVFIVLIFVIIIYKKSFTGQVIQEICYEQEICENITIQICDDFCYNVCENITLICESECNEICEEIDNETICQEVCEPCEDEIILECNETCEKINCIEKIIENCSIQEICEEVVINETNKTEEKIEIPSDEKSTEEIFQEEIIEEISQEETILEKTSSGNLSLEELNLLESKTGEKIISITKSEIIDGRLIIKFEIGNYWIEKSYSYPDEEVEFKINNDKIMFARKISNLGLEEINIVKKEEFLGEYEL
jgi:hypothetical protein